MLMVIELSASSLFSANGAAFITAWAAPQESDFIAGGSAEGGTQWDLCLQKRVNRAFSAGDWRYAHFLG
jgi:hypothetical protein